MRRPLVLGVAVALLVTGCSNPRSGTLGAAPTLAPSGQSAGAGPAPSAGASTTPPAVADPGRPGTITIQLWFTRDGRLSPTRRTRPATLATSRLALTELTAGPSAAEDRAGLTTGLTADAGFTIEGISGGVETVRFGPAFYAGGSAAVRLRQAQVVYTLTQFPTVTRVRFAGDGQSAGTPVGRGEYADLLPPIVVLDPVIGQRVSSPIVVTGTADVFEATVNVRLLDANGQQIATAFTTASCGSGCRGDFRIRLPYRSGGGRAATVEAYWVSPKDGSRRDTAAVPIRLS
jgi:immunoglobulin-like protein involved in spore germination/sporulation and spore germination protein